MESFRNLPYGTLKDLSSVIGPRAPPRREKLVLNEISQGLHVMRRLRYGAKRSLRGYKERKLTRLFSQPSEIFHEILALLHPIDLYHMAHASKALHAFITSPECKRIWILAFKRNPPIPPCPSDMPFFKWACLLFRRSCQRCGVGGAKSVIHPNMNWRHRLCYVCTREWAYTVIEIEREGNLKTSYDGESHQDVQEVADRLGAWIHISPWDGNFVEVIDLETSEGTKNIVASIVAIREKYKIWKDFLDHEVALESQAQSDIILHMFSARLRKEGHLEHHVQQLFDGHSTKHLEYLFEARAQELEERLAMFRGKALRSTKRYIHDSFKQRAEALLYMVVTPRVRTLLHAERADKIKRLWSRYVTSLDATAQCAELPDILLSEPFVTMLNDPSDNLINDDQITTALASFADLWLPRTMGDLFSTQPSKPLIHIEGPLLAPHAYSINSAASVFSCRECEAKHGHPRYVVGWSFAAAHVENCSDDYGTSFASFDLFDPGPVITVNEAGCAAALSLLELLGLDPRTTFTHNMDQRDTYFACTACAEAHGPTTNLSWRECISHSIEVRDQQSHSVPSWKVMSEGTGSLSDSSH